MTPAAGAVTFTALSIQYHGSAAFPLAHLHRPGTTHRQGLASDRGDEIEVCVIMQHGNGKRFGCRGDQEVRDLAATLTALGQQPLHLKCPPDVCRGRLD